MQNQTVRHVLVLKFSPQASAEVLQEFVNAFRSLSKEIPGIQSFEYGSNNSPEGLNKGMTHVISLTFANAQARDAYLPHPAHVKFGQWMGGLGILDDILVIDYVPQE